MKHVTCQFGTRVAPQGPKRKPAFPKFSAQETAKKENLEFGFTGNNRINPSVENQMMLRAERRLKVLKQVRRRPKTTHEIADRAGETVNITIRDLRRLEGFGMVRHDGKVWFDNGMIDTWVLAGEGE